MREPKNVIDELDRKVLVALRDHPRSTLSEQAEVVGVSRTTFKARLDRLWDTGIIIGHEAQLNLSMLGFNVQAWIELDVRQEEWDAVTELLASLDEVVEAFATTGDADIQCRVAARDTDHLHDIVRELNAHTAVVRTRSSVILGSIVSHRKVQALGRMTL